MRPTDSAGTHKPPTHALRLTAATLAIAGIAAAAFFLARLRSDRLAYVPPEVGPARARETVPVPGVRFTDVTDAAGIRFRHGNGAAGQKLLPETMGSGGAGIDFDGAGRPDPGFVHSPPWAGH